MKSLLLLSLLIGLTAYALQDKPLTDKELQKACKHYHDVYPEEKDHNGKYIDCQGYLLQDNKVQDN